MVPKCHTQNSSSSKIFQARLKSFKALENWVGCCWVDGKPKLKTLCTNPTKIHSLRLFKKSWVLDIEGRSAETWNLMKFESKWKQYITSISNPFFLVIKWICFHLNPCFHLPGNVSRGWVGWGAACSNAPGVQEIKSKGTGFRYLIAIVILYDFIIIRSGSVSLWYYHPMGCMLPT